jgi:ribokinase
VAAAVEAATAAGVPCVLNPAPVIPAVLSALDRGPILTPNASELLDLVAMLGDEASDVRDGARRLVARTGAAVVVTLGGDGALALAPGADADRVPAALATVRDTTGAGDTFNGVLATRLAAGDALDVAVRMATVAASLSVGRVGAREGMPDAAAIDAALAAGAIASGA